MTFFRKKSRTIGVRLRRMDRVRSSDHRAPSISHSRIFLPSRVFMAFRGSGSQTVSGIPPGGDRSYGRGTRPMTDRYDRRSPSRGRPPDPGLAPVTVVENLYLSHSARSAGDPQQRPRRAVSSVLRGIATSATTASWLTVYAMSAYGLAAGERRSRRWRRAAFRRNGVGPSRPRRHAVRARRAGQP